MLVSMAKNDIFSVSHTADSTRGSAMVCQNEEKPMPATVTAIMANGSTTSSDRHRTVIPRLMLKPGSTLGVFNRRMVGWLWLKNRPTM